jgi:hypothetical protein
VLRWTVTAVGRPSRLERVTRASTAHLAVEAMQAARWSLLDYRRGRVRDTQVDGARDALRLDYSYTSVEGGVSRPAAGTDVAALLERDVYVVRITWLKGGLSEQDLAAMVASVELRDGT